MAKKIDPVVREYLAKLGKKGGRTRAKFHDAETLSEWGRMGGRPRQPESGITENAKYQRARRAKQRRERES